MARVEAVISDFGGVLTSPLAGSFAAFQEMSGIPLAELGHAMVAVTEARGINPLFELETGQITEAEFLGLLADQLTQRLGREVTLDGFGERYIAHLEPNEPFIEYMRALRERGYRMAICTNNVREWSSMWRAMLPVQEIFDVVVDSAYVGARKPDPPIFEITLDELGVPAQSAVLIDDVAENCEAARALGLRAVWFQSTDQAIEETEAVLREGGQ